jgi:hypothetical protein
MKKTAFVIIAVAALFGLFYVATSHIPVSLPVGTFANDNDRDPAADGVGTTSEVDVPVPASISLPPPAGVSLTRAADPFPELIRTRENAPLDGDPWGPTSKEEQAWLDRNGFPTGQQMDAYFKASDQVLEQAIQAGDRTAGVFLDARKLALGDEAARNRLVAAAADGSLYALSSLTAYYGSKPSQSGTAYAYSISRVSEMLGDFRAGSARELFAGRPLNPVERQRAEENARTIYNLILAARQERSGAGARIVDPRPVKPIGKK